MKVVLTLICLVILLCGSASGTRIELFQAKGQNGMAAFAAAATDGVCKTIVKPQGYAREEHKFICLLPSVFLLMKFRGL